MASKHHNPIVAESHSQTAENVADVLKFLSVMDTAACTANLGELSDDVSNGKVLIFDCAIAALASIANTPAGTLEIPPGERGKLELVEGGHHA